MSPPVYIHRRQGFTLVGLILILPLLAFFGFIIFQGFSAQLKIHRRIAEHAHRQAVMRSILNRVRLDMAESTRLVLEAAESHTPDQNHQEIHGVFEDTTTKPTGVDSEPNEDHSSRDPSSGWVTHIVSPFHLITPRGIVRYYIQEERPVVQHPSNTTRPPPPPKQTWVRTDVDGTILEWSLFGQRITILPEGSHGRGTPEAASSPLSDHACSALQLRFDSFLHFETGNNIVRRYDTTLRIGGTP